MCCGASKSKSVPSKGADFFAKTLFWGLTTHLNHGIISHVVKRHGAMAQSVEHIVHIDGVVGSSPTGTTHIKRHPLWVVFFMYVRRAQNLRRPERRTHIDGRKTARRQWQKQQGFALKQTSRCQWQKQQGKMFTDRAQRDRRFESCWRRCVLTGSSLDDIMLSKGDLHRKGVDI